MADSDPALLRFWFGIEEEVVGKRGWVGMVWKCPGEGSLGLAFDIELEEVGMVGSGNGVNMFESIGGVTISASSNSPPSPPPPPSPSPPSAASPSAAPLSPPCPSSPTARLVASFSALALARASLFTLAFSPPFSNNSLAICPFLASSARTSSSSKRIRAIRLAVCWIISSGDGRVG